MGMVFLSELGADRRELRVSPLSPVGGIDGCDVERVVRLAAALYRGPSGLWLRDGRGGVGCAATVGQEPALPGLACRALAEQRVWIADDGLAVPVSDLGHPPCGALAVAGDISRGPESLADLARLLETERALRRSLKTDALTGAASRPYFLSRLGEACATGQRGALLLVDVDYFKAINDRHGHAVGDRILHQVVARMSRRIGPGALVGRLGGEEFALLVPGADEESLTALGVLVCRSVAERGFGMGAGARIRITVSIGAVTLRAAGDATDLLLLADAALYRAKAAGRNCVALSSPGAGAAAMTVPPRQATG